MRATLSERAQEASIDVFSMNVERLLTQPPIKDRWVLGFDPRQVRFAHIGVSFL